MLILSVVIIFVLLMGSELWWRKKQPHNELSRKFVHITVGSFAAFWPWFLSWRQILFLSAAFLVVIGISRYLNLFQAIHAVERATWGEVYFAISVGALALLTHDRLLYMAALLHMSLADGLAAVVGVHFGKSNSYTVFHHAKSIIGTVTFFVVSLAILFGYTALRHGGVPIVDVVVLSAAATAIENLAVFGLDNVVVPLLVAFVLQRIG